MSYRSGASVAGHYVAFVLVFLAGIVGCNGDTRVGKTVPVAGTVTLDGKPLATGSVAYYPSTPAQSDAMLVPGSPINEQGMYNLFVEGKEGAPVGKYKVVVVATVPSRPADEYSASKSLVDSRYTRPESTPLEIEVSADAAPGAYDLQLSK